MAKSQRLAEGRLVWWRGGLTGLKDKETVVKRVRWPMGKF